MRRLDNDLEYERHYIADPAQPVVITSIIANNAGVVRSHFERVMSVADACQHREHREEAAAGRRRETEERSRMQTEDFNINDSVIQTKEMRAMQAEDKNVEASAMDT